MASTYVKSKLSHVFCQAQAQIRPEPKPKNPPDLQLWSTQYLSIIDAATWRANYADSSFFCILSLVPTSLFLLLWFSGQSLQIRFSVA